MIQQQYPQVPVELWAMDEHRIGLKPILRRVWAPKGTPVRAVVAPRYEWMYVYGFVHPQSGETIRLASPLPGDLQAFLDQLAAGSGEP